MDSTIDWTGIEFNLTPTDIWPSGSNDTAVRWKATTDLWESTTFTIHVMGGLDMDRYWTDG